MKKILSVILIIFTLTTIIFAIPASAVPSVVEQNAQILYDALVIARQQTPQHILELPTHGIYRPLVVSVAQTLYILTGGRIVDVRIHINVEPENWLDRYHALITDHNDNAYLLMLTESGSLSAILDSDHQILWSFHEGPGIQPWWMIFSPWLQCVLRVVFFGWIWMR